MIPYNMTEKGDRSCSYCIHRNIICDDESCHLECTITHRAIADSKIAETCPDYESQ